MKYYAVTHREQLADVYLSLHLKSISIKGKKKNMWMTVFTQMGLCRLSESH